MKITTKVMTVFDHTVNIGAYLAGILVVFIMLIISFEVTSRWVVERSWEWVLPFSEFSLLYITFLGTAWLLKTDGHPSLDLVVNMLKPRSQDLLNASMSIFGAIICLVVAGWGARTTWNLFQSGIHYLEVLELPIAPHAAIIPIGSFLLFIQFLRRAHRYLKGRRASLPEEQRSQKGPVTLNSEVNTTWNGG